MNESTFLCSLLDDPTDEVTWLALADWLEEDGQSDRAELIRLVRTLRTVPVMKRSKRRAALEDRVAELLRAGVRPAVPEITNSVGMRLALIPPGHFRMGSPRDESERGREEVIHEVSITKPFYLGVFSVTQEQFALLMGDHSNHCSDSGARDRVAGLDTRNFPAEMVSWDDAREFCRRLSQRDGRTYRLPTEAEWEYACRGGSASTTAFYFGDRLTTDLANFDGQLPSSGDARSGLGRTCPVGSYPPNVFGLYDMHGNVFQWCSDWIGAYERKSAKDPTGPAEGSYRTIRGGGWACEVKHCRSANRGQNDVTYRGYQNGVRVALSG
jgi:uncharacterized protein (TIGR02996 family)